MPGYRRLLFPHWGTLWRASSASELLLSTAEDSLCLNYIPISPSRWFPRWLKWSRIHQQSRRQQEMHVWSLVLEDPLQEKMATHSNIIAWWNPREEEPGGLFSLGSQRVGHDWARKPVSLHPVLLPSIPCKCWSQDNSLINFLLRNFSLIICFVGNPTCGHHQLISE